MPKHASCHSCETYRRFGPSVDDALEESLASRLRLLIDEDLNKRRWQAASERAVLGRRLLLLLLRLWRVLLLLLLCWFLLLFRLACVHLEPAERAGLPGRVGGQAEVGAGVQRQHGGDLQSTDSGRPADLSRGGGGGTGRAAVIREPACQEEGEGCEGRGRCRSAVKCRAMGRQCMTEVCGDAEVH